MKSNIFDLYFKESEMLLLVKILEATLSSEKMNDSYSAVSRLLNAVEEELSPVNKAHYLVSYFRRLLLRVTNYEEEDILENSTLEKSLKLSQEHIEFIETALHHVLKRRPEFNRYKIDFRNCETVGECEIVLINLIDT